MSNRKENSEAVAEKIRTHKDFERLLNERAEVTGAGLRLLNEINSETEERMIKVLQKLRTFSQTISNDLAFSNNHPRFAEISARKNQLENLISSLIVMLSGQLTLRGKVIDAIISGPVQEEYELNFQALNELIDCLNQKIREQVFGPEAQEIDETGKKMMMLALAGYEPHAFITVRIEQGLKRETVKALLEDACGVSDLSSEDASKEFFEKNLG